MRLLSTIAALTVAACLAVVPVSAAAAAPETAPGADVSWPQCSKALIPPQAFGIVGVNNENNASGNTTNDCLTAELNWAGGSSAGSAEQPKTSLYAMAQDPGTGGSWWPSSNRTRSGEPRWPIRYGTCATGQENRGLRLRVRLLDRGAGH